MMTRWKKRKKRETNVRTLQAMCLAMRCRKTTKRKEDEEKSSKNQKQSKIC